MPGKLQTYIKSTGKGFIIVPPEVIVFESHLIFSFSKYLLLSVSSRHGARGCPPPPEHTAIQPEFVTHRLSAQQVIVEKFSHRMADKARAFAQMTQLPCDQCRKKSRVMKGAGLLEGLGNSPEK